VSQIVERSPLNEGRKAFERHSWHEAFDLLSEINAAEPLASEDLERLAEAAWWTGRLDECLAVRERAFTGFLNDGRPRRAAMMALLLAQDYFNKLAHSLGAGWFGRAERLLENEEESPEHGHLAVMQTFSMFTVGDLDSALGCAERVLDIGTRFGDRDLQAYGLLFKGKVFVSKGDVDQGLPLLDEATVAAVSGDIGPYASGIVYCVAISTTASLADYERASQWTEASKRWCERQSITGFPGVCRVHRAEIMRLRGSWAEAEVEARRALSELQNFNLEFAAMSLYELGELRFRMGDLEAAEDAFRQAHEMGWDPQPGLALLRMAEGKTDAALSAIRRALDNPSHDRLERCRLLPAQVDICIESGELDEARRAVEEMEATAERYRSRPLQASAKCARGALQLAEGDTAAAVQILSQSRRLWTDSDLPYEAARARVMLGRALRASGDEDGARLELEAARTAFEKLGAPLDLRKTLDLLGKEAVARLSQGGGRTTKTFMFTDIVGSTNLAELLGDDSWRSLLAWHDQMLRGLFGEHLGEEVKHQGDGFFVAFDEPTAAVECAVAIQRRLAVHRKEHGFAPQVRIGLHTTEASREGRDFRGTGIHEAARIGALAQSGEILVSDQVLSGARIRFPTSERRKVELKGVSEPVEVATIDPTAS
jgi:class 3 adenylate cyclase